MRFHAVSFRCTRLPSSESLSKKNSSESARKIISSQLSFIALPSDPPASPELFALPWPSLFASPSVTVPVPTTFDRSSVDMASELPVFFDHMVGWSQGERGGGGWEAVR
jgi:hypothetical protein